MSTINENIKKFRLELNMTQKDLADVMGYKSASTIAKIEAGENTVDIPTACRLAEIFSVSPSMLAGWETDESQEKNFIKDFRKLNRKWKQYIIQQMQIAKTMQQYAEQFKDDEERQSIIDELLDEGDIDE